MPRFEHFVKQNTQNVCVFCKVKKPTLIKQQVRSLLLVKSLNRERTTKDIREM